MTRGTTQSQKVSGKRSQQKFDAVGAVVKEEKKNTEMFLAINRKGQQFGGHEELDYVGHPNTGWRFYIQSRGNLQTSASGSQSNLEAASSSSSTWDQTQWKTNNWNSQHSSSPDKW